MKLTLKTPSGNATVDLAMSAPDAGGQVPNAQGQSVMQLIAGWGHGSTAGLGGVDWTAGCGTFRGESYQMGPSFNQEAKQGKACAEAGVGRICSPNTPKGAWQFPVRFKVPSAGFVTYRLSMPVAARLYALEVCSTIVQLAVPVEVPCGCEDCGGVCQFLRLRNFKSRQVTTTYPGVGRDSGVLSSAGVLTPYEPNTTPAPSCLYSPKRLLNGQNFLPPWVPNVELENGNDELQWELVNDHPTNELDVEMVLHIQYGEFDLAAAIADNCKQCAA